LFAIDWTEKKQQRLTELVAKHITYAKIAVIMSKEFRERFTANGCSGKYHRLQQALEKPRGPITLVDLQHRDCRWPMNEGSPYLFCGEVRADGFSYCMTHCLISYPGMRYLKGH
jgi:hypothetical protein